MSESIFSSIIEEWAERDWASYADAPEFKTSKKHDRTMRRIFKRYEKNTRKLRPKAEIRARTVRRRITVALIVIILAVITGFTMPYFISRSFNGKVYSDHTELFPIDRENCPTVIEEKYYLSELPDGFEEIETDSDPYFESFIYKNKQTEQYISFRQWVKTEFDTIDYNTEKGELVEIEINGHYGVCLDLSTETENYVLIIWDNGDYILQLSGDLPKNASVELAKNAKVFNNQIVSS